MANKICSSPSQEAEAQHGAVLVTAENRSRLRGSEWTWLEPRVKGLASWQDKDRQRLMAAVLGSGGVASHRAAAWLHHLDGFETATVELIVPRESGYRSHTVHRIIDLPKFDVTVVDNISCTTATRTIIDLAAVSDAEAVAAALESAVRRGLTSPRYVRRRLDALAKKGRRRLDVARAVLAEHVGVTDSEMERRYLALCRRTGLPRPVLHHPIGDYEVDCAYPEIQLAIELDGFGVHGTKSSFKKDRQRQNWLVLHGWAVLRFTWDDLRDYPDRVVTTVLAALAA